MKTIRNIYHEISSFENLYNAYQKARRGKRYLEYAVEFEQHLEENIINLSQELGDKSYLPGSYRTFWIKEPKPRLISAAPFRDRVVHHALIDVLEPLMDPIMIEHNYACRRGKGSHLALHASQRYLRRFSWVLKCDIRKYFPSIDHQILLEIMKKHISDTETMHLISIILNGSNPQESVLHWFPGDDLFSPIERRKGLPIGNLTSQFFANMYLNGFDHYIKQKLGIKGYLRYMDDFLLFGNSKADLFEIRAKIVNYLSGLRLRLHPRKQEIFPAKSGISFLGFTIYTYLRRLSQVNIKRFRCRMQSKITDIEKGRLTYDDYKRSLIGWIGHARHGDTWRLRELVFSKLIIPWNFLCNKPNSESTM